MDGQYQTTSDTLVERDKGAESLNEIVDNLLRDKDYLLAQELKHRISELNDLLQQAHNQGLRLNISASHEIQESEIELARLELKIFREI